MAGISSPGEGVEISHVLAIFFESGLSLKLARSHLMYTPDNNRAARSIKLYMGSFPL